LDDDTFTRIECMSKKNFQFRPLHPIFGSAGLAEHATASHRLKPLRRVALPRARAAKEPP
jgi:hypothetical protein